MASFLDRHGGYCTCTRDKCTDDCAIYRRFKPKHMTNADRIRSMTDEELEDFLDRWGLGDIDYSKTFCSLCDGQFDCHECRLDWLRKEYKSES